MLDRVKLGATQILSVFLEPVLFLAGSRMVLILKVRMDSPRDRLKDSLQSCHMNLGKEVDGFLLLSLLNFRMIGTQRINSEAETSMYCVSTLAISNPLRLAKKSKSSTETPHKPCLIIISNIASRCP